MSDRDRFAAALQQLVGLPCWSIIGLPHESATLSFRFGAAEFSLFLFCAWRITTADRIVASSACRTEPPADAPPDEKTRPPGSEIILGPLIRELTLDRAPGHDLRITFANQSVLTLFCDICEGEIDNYSFFTPSCRYTVETGGRLKLEPQKQS